MKISILFFSKTGTTKEAAEYIIEGINTVEGTEVKAFSIDEIDADWVRKSSCVIVGTPTYYADLAGSVKLFLENTKEYALSGKLGGAFATADYVHGGGDIAIETILRHMMVLGMSVYSGGGSYGKPVIHLGPVAIKDNLADFKDTFKIYGHRMATQVKTLK